MKYININKLFTGSSLYIYILNTFTTTVADYATIIGGV